MLRLAQTSYGTTPDEQAVVVDVYDAAPDSPTNNFRKSIPNKKGSLLKGIGKATGSSKGLPNLLNKGSLFSKDGKLSGIVKGLTKAYSSEGKLGSKALAGVLAEATGVPLNSMMTNPTQFAASAAKALGFGNTSLGKDLDAIAKGVGLNDYTQLVLDKDKNIFAMYKDLEKTVKGFKDVDSLSDLSNLVGKLSGDNGLLKFFNLSEFVDGVKVANRLFQEYNLPSVVDKYIEKLETKKQKKAAYLELLKDTRISNDLDFINGALDNVGSGTILTQSPNIIQEILSGYTGVGEYSEPENLKSFDYLNNTLKRIDATWWLSKDIGDGQAFDLNLFKSLSRYVKACFVANDKYMVPTMIAEQYSTESDFNSQLIQNYPWAVINTA